jgi:hypothetical protein
MEVNSSSVKSSRLLRDRARWSASRFEVEIERDVAVDGDEFFGEQDGVAVLLEGFAVGLALDFGIIARAVEDGFDAAELLDEFDGAFVADAGSAGDVVDGVAAQGHDVDDLFREGRRGLSITLAGSRMRLSFCGLRTRTCSVTSCIMSLSPETMKTSWPCFGEAWRARVPMTSSASKPIGFEDGDVQASRERRM